MKVIKTRKQSISFQVFKDDKSYHLSAAVLHFFSFNRSSLLPETELWKFITEELGKEAMIDMGFPKPRGEVLVSGKCFVPDGEPVPACEVRLRFGPIDKTLYVFGDRFWQYENPLIQSISEPLHFKEIDISYGNAFGGLEFENNPLGKGAAPVETDTGELIQPLPNIEMPEALIGSPDDRPDPAGFAPIDLTWPQRMSKMGTYDDTWLKERFPGFAADMDPTCLNDAQPDQWTDDFFKGDEPFELHNMHPEEPVLGGKLPGFRTRVFINQKTDDSESFREIGMHAETAWFFPHAKKGVLIHRGVTEINTDDAEDILHLMAAYESLDEAPLSFEHYVKEFERRADEEKGFLLAFQDKGLVPQSEVDAQVEEDSEDKHLYTGGGMLAENMQKKAEKKKQEAMKKLEKICEKYSLDPEKVMTPPPTPPPKMPEIDPNNLNPDEIIRFMKEAEADAMARKEKAMADAMAKKAQAEKKIKEICDKQGLDFDKVMAKLQAQKPKRPVFSADATIEKLKKARATVEKQVSEACAKLGIDYDTAVAQAKELSGEKKFPMIEAIEGMKKLDPDNPELLEKLKLAEEKSKEAYKKTAQHLPEPESIAPEEADRLKQTFIAMHAQGQRFEGKDFAGTDLSGMDLKNTDLRGIYLEGANLSGTDLTGTDLSGAVLSWADLSGAKLNRAKMHETCLGCADLTNAEVKDADLAEGVLSKSNLTGTDFSGTSLDKVELMEATFDNTNLSNTSLTETIFLETDFSGADFSGADLTETIFIKPKLDEVNFSEAKAEGVNFIEASCENAVFINADLTNARFPQNANLKGADFSGAVLDNANLMEADLTDASFVKASMNNANLMKANLKNADLTGITAKKASFMKADLEEARMVGANLMEASLMNASLVNTDLKNANLYGAEVMRAVFEETDLREANLKMTKIDDRESE